MTGKLTVLGLRALVRPGRYVDGDGLHLHVRSADRRAWVFRYTRRGRTRDLGLGAFPDVSLAEARRAAAAARAQLRDGIDPVEVRRKLQGAAETRTFKAAAEEYIAAHQQGWRNPKYLSERFLSPLSRL